MKVVNILLFIVFGSFANAIVAEESKVLAKCHVELLGGGNTIYRQTIKPKNLNKLSQMLKNRSITVVGEKEKIKVYNVVECALDEESFNKQSSRMLDEKQAK